MKIDMLEVEIESTRKEINKLKNKITRLCGKRDALLIEKNQDNFTDIEWLVNNPNTPGQWEAVREWLCSEYGGEYNGVTACGYYPSVNQQCFGFTFRTYGDEGRVERYIENIKKFVKTVVPFLKPVEDGFVGFTYATGQYSGIFSIDYRTEDKTWWTSNTRYSRKNSEVQHASLDDAIAFAIAKAEEIDD